MNEIIIERMKETSAEHNMTIHQVIQKGGLTKSTISELLSGRTKHTKVKNDSKFYEGLDIPINDFFNGPKFKYFFEIHYF